MFAPVRMPCASWYFMFRTNFLLFSKIKNKNVPMKVMDTLWSSMKGSL